MQFLVTFEVFDTITEDEPVRKVRAAVGKQMVEAQKLVKITTGGIFADGRGGFLVLDVESAEKLLESLGGPILDHCHVTSRPVVSFEALGEFFKKHPV